MIPKDIAPLIFEASTRKKWKVNQALHNNEWIKKIKMDMELSLAHIHEYIRLWILLSDIHLVEDTNDSIIWNLTPSGEYSATSVYNAQFFVATQTNMNKLVWKVWAPPKIKFFAWLAIRNRLWTSDRLERRGWDNFGICPLCKQYNETTTHLFLHCQYTKRLWEMIRDWLDLTSIWTNEWMNDLSLKYWWSRMSFKATNKLCLPSPCMLVGRFGRSITQESLTTSVPRPPSSLRSSRTRLGFGSPLVQKHLGVVILGE
jgi:hypothetical protein